MRAKVWLKSKWAVFARRGTGAVWLRTKWAVFACWGTGAVCHISKDG